MNEEEYKQEILNQERGININLIDVQNQLDKQNKMIDDIKFCINLIAFIVFVPFIIKIITIIILLFSGYNILQEIGNIMNMI